ncbi:hypothetical protein NL676_003035 [Syzygium grande]|nr:hypothetical protein NL676_003035 [Syzygium grande]
MREMMKKLRIEKVKIDKELKIQEREHEKLYRKTQSKSQLKLEQIVLNQVSSTKVMKAKSAEEFQKEHQSQLRNFRGQLRMLTRPALRVE